MGVISTGKPEPRPVRLEDHLQDYMLLESDDEEAGEEEREYTSLPPTPRRQKRNNRNFRLMMTGGTGGGRGERRPGARKQRRLDSARLLNSLVDPEDVCEDLSDLVPSSASPFTRLFLEQESMKVWNAFIEKSEEEQEAILHGGRTMETGRMLGGARTRLGAEKRDVHPAYSGENCFRRVDAKFRTLLLRQHHPWGRLENVEMELRGFFSANPDGIWVSMLESAYDRLLLHAVAQYLNLHSRSFNCGGGKRETQVENWKSYFVPPLETLVGLLRQGTSRET